MNVLSEIFSHLYLLKYQFDDYPWEEMKKFDLLSWICNPNQDDIPTSKSTKASEGFIDLSEDTENNDQNHTAFPYYNNKRENNEDFFPKTVNQQNLFKYFGPISKGCHQQRK